MTDRRASVLVVGASRGIGLELVRRYAAEGWQVYATVRDLARAGAVAEVRGDLHLHRLEVTDPGQIEALRAALADTPLDVLVHNAGVKDGGLDRATVMAVNAAAPLRVAEALLDCVAASAQRKLVVMSSQMGARHGQRGSLGLYGDSKAALNDAFRARVPAWAERGVTAIVMHPGWVRTDMGGRGAPLSVAESVRGIVQVIAALTPADHGRFLTWEGREHAW